MKPQPNSRIRHNVVRERVTTALGIILFLATLASVFLVTGMTWGDAWVPMAISLVLMLMPDRALGLVRRAADKKAQATTDYLPVLALAVGVGLLGLLAACAGRAALEDSAGTSLKVVVKKGSVAISTGDSSPAEVSSPATIKASGSATLATAPSSTATNNAGIGKRAAGGVNTAENGSATGAILPEFIPWPRILASALCLVVVVLLAYYFGWPLVWAWIRKRALVSTISPN